MSERTPAGGDRSEATFIGPDGQPLPDAEGAVEVEIREYAGSVMIARTYLHPHDPTRTPQWSPPGQTRGEPDMSDNVKNTWDVYLSDNGQHRLVTTLPDLFAAMEIGHATPDVQRAALTNLMNLPSWRAAPAELKQDAGVWLATH